MLHWYGMLCWSPWETLHKIPPGTLRTSKHFNWVLENTEKGWTSPEDGKRPWSSVHRHLKHDTFKTRLFTTPMCSSFFYWLLLILLLAMEVINEKIFSCCLLLAHSVTMPAMPYVCGKTVPCCCSSVLSLVCATHLNSLLTVLIQALPNRSSTS